MSKTEERKEAIKAMLRPKAIRILLENGLSQSDIVILFSANERGISRQRVWQIQKNLKQGQVSSSTRTIG